MVQKNCTILHELACLGCGPTEAAPGETANKLLQQGPCFRIHSVKLIERFTREKLEQGSNKVLYDLDR